MNGNYIYWLLGIFAVGALITVIGQVTGRNLPAKQKKLRMQRFSAAALALIAFSIPAFTPHFSSHSRTRHLKELKAENLNSIEQIVEFDNEQTRNIESLKSEIQDLREEHYIMNRHYRFLIQMFSTAIATICLVFIFRKQEKESEEIQSDQISKL